MPAFLRPPHGLRDALFRPDLHLDRVGGSWHDCPMTNNHIDIHITAYGETLLCRVETDRYTNGRLCLALVYWDHDMEGWFPHCKVTTNLPDQHLNEGEVFVKDWSENEPIVEALIEEGWLIPTGREVISGFIAPAVMRLGGPLEGIA